MRPKSGRNQRPQRQHGGTFLGIVIGVVLGLGAALAVAVYLIILLVLFWPLLFKLIRRLLPARAEAAVEHLSEELHADLDTDIDGHPLAGSREPELRLPSARTGASADPTDPPPDDGPTGTPTKEYR